MINKIVLVALLANTLMASAQNLVSTPAFGGITATTARIFVKTEVPKTFQIELSTNENFTNATLITDSTRANLYGSVIVNVSALQPFTRYYYQFKFNGIADSLNGSFKTFPVENDNSNYLKIAVGSCNYFPNSSLFQSIKDFNPDFFIHLGDWIYVPSSPGFGWDYNLFPEKRANAFPEKFNDPMMKQYILPNMGIDYIYDDDYSQNDSEGDYYPSDNTTTNGNGDVVTRLTLTPMPLDINRGARQAYAQYFPGYAMADSSKGIFHSFKMGNAEIFMTDVRMARTPRYFAFEYDSVANFWKFEPDSTHSILGETQRNWLINGLKNSTADWKILGTGLVFNKNYKRLIDIGMLLQGLALEIAGVQGSGVTLAYSLANNWAGFPVDLNAVLDLKNKEGVKNIIAISGDTHSSVIDDGRNAGIPELNASGLAAGDEAYLNFYIDSIVRTLGNQSIREILWSVGGNGIDNRNFSDSYGTIEIFGDDSLRMCVVDELNETLACATIQHEKTTGAETKIWKANSLMNLIYPNPAKDVIHVLLNENIEAEKKDRIAVYDINGKLIDAVSVQKNNEPIAINVVNYNNGNYIIRYEGKKKTESKKILIQK